MARKRRTKPSTAVILKQREKESRAVSQAFVRSFDSAPGKKRESALLKRIGRTRAELKAAADKFARDTKAAAKKLTPRAPKSVLRDPRLPAKRLAPPPPSPEPVIYPVCFFPANSGVSDPSPNAANAAKASMKVFDASSGVGGMLGILGHPVPQTQTKASLSYNLTAPLSGELIGNVWVVVNGMAFVDAHENGFIDDLISRESAQASLDLQIVVSVNGSLQWPWTFPVFAMQCGNAESDLRIFNWDNVLQFFANVQEGDDIEVTISVRVLVEGVTDFARAEVDFASNGNGILVPALCVDFAPITIS